MSNIEVDAYFLQMLLQKESTYVPTTHLSGYWVAAANPKKSFINSDLSGKWIIQLEEKEVDSVWKKIKKACKSGKFELAKCSTLLMIQEVPKYKDYVICVYTNDWSDLNDVKKVRENLRKLGIEQPLKYKRDLETRNGVYGTNDEFYIVET